MKRTTHKALSAILFVTLAVFAFGTRPVSSQSTTGATTIGSVHLTQSVLADGKPLAAGTYQVRLTGDQPAPAAGASPGAERWIEFVKGGRVAGREVATVISSADIATVAKGPRPAPNGSRVDALKGGDYVRVWIHQAGNHYIINMPSAR
jgi:hypothetical protein